MAILLFLAPFAAGLAAFVIKSDRFRRRLLFSVACAHAVFSLYLCLFPSGGEDYRWLWFGLDALGRYFTAVFSLLFLCASFYAVIYLKEEKSRPREKKEEGLLFNNAPEAAFTGCLLVFLASMSLLALSRHFGLIWIAMEATTLVSAPLIYFHRQRSSLEATWKYLLICSVGIALALFGNLFLAVSASGQGPGTEISIDRLLGPGVRLDPLWLKAGFIFVLVGYGTKMGLAPMHTWLPDAHSEAPSVASALLSGALLNCAFLAILRFYQLCLANGLGPFCRELFLIFGILSMAVAAVFIIGQSDYKRLLAYSSVEHMGILCFAVAVGTAYGSMLQAANHSFLKGALFICAGNILAGFRSKKIADVRGIAHIMPWAGVLWFAGILAICGMPPFGAFLSEWIILKAAFSFGNLWLPAVYLFLLGVIFIGMTGTGIRMTFGVPSIPGGKKSFLSLLPALLLLLLSLFLGIYMPAALDVAVSGAAALLGGQG
ncbi:MAG: proton-conducting transporter membrane subunit [Candidatus Omnitrophota bacterium]|jgi:hydrogenase-4 component F|nr:proton-conducting transporter membrane subunit [Candidatus Omnitrophota bacterium]